METKHVIEQTSLFTPSLSPPREIKKHEGNYKPTGGGLEQDSKVKYLPQVLVACSLLQLCP